MAGPSTSCNCERLSANTVPIEPCAEAASDLPTVNIVGNDCHGSECSDDFDEDGINEGHFICRRRRGKDYEARHPSLELVIFSESPYFQCIASG